MATPPSTDEQSISAAGNGDRPKVEIGWILEGDMPGAQRDAVKAAAVSMEHALSDCMPRFDWVIETLERPAETDRGRIEPVRLLDAAEVDRDMRGWDFALVVTARQLHGRERSRVLGVTSSIFATAILSTAFLTNTDLDTGRTADRLHALAMHLFGQLNGLTADRSNTWMGRLGTADDLDGMGGFGDEALADLADRMKDVADLRVEEMQAPRQGKAGFYARSLWLNRGALPRAILRMRPWSFPLRLRRLTTAAGSALAVLVMTAESWEVAASLSFGTIALLSLVSLTATSTYLLKVQRLLASRGGPLREQRAVSNAGTVIAVGLGMLVTYLGLFAVAWLMAYGLFGDALLERWVGVPGGGLPTLRMQMAALTASLGVFIGALGASFEPYGYFRHVTQVDDEI